MEGIQNNRLFSEIVKPLLTCLICSGSYICRSGVGKCYKILLKIYAVLVAILAVAITVQLGFTLYNNSESQHFLLQVVNLVNYGFLTMHILHNTYSSRHVLPLCDQIGEVCQTSLQAHKPVIRKWVWAFMWSTVILQGLLTFGLMLFIPFLGDWKESFMMFVPTPLQGTYMEDISLILHFLLFLPSFISWLSKIALLAAISYILIREFVSLKLKLQEGITSSKDLDTHEVDFILEEMEQWRRHHRKLSKLVTQTDELYQFQLGCVLLITVANFCLLIYILSVNGMVDLEMVYPVALLMITVLCFVICYLVSARLSHEVSLILCFYILLFILLVFVKYQNKQLHYRFMMNSIYIIE